MPPSSPWHRCESSRARHTNEAQSVRSWMAGAIPSAAWLSAELARVPRRQPLSPAPDLAAAAAPQRVQAAPESLGPGRGARGCRLVALLLDLLNRGTEHTAALGVRLARLLQRPLLAVRTLLVHAAVQLRAARGQRVRGLAAAAGTRGLLYERITAQPSAPASTPSCAGSTCSGTTRRTWR
jgi:hypothetical protein